jgi:hypothetical protein
VLSFSLVVSNGFFNSSASDVVITVAPVVILAPTARAGVAAQSVLAKSLVTLSGAASSDPQQLPLTFAWTQTSGAAVQLSNSSAMTPTFTAPALDGVLTFSLVVSNGVVASNATSVSVTVKAPLVPFAVCGGTQTVVAGASVTLSGAGSSDPQLLPLAYLWKQTAGRSVVLSSFTAVSPSFTAPATAGSLTFSLVVTNGALASLAATTVVTVLENVALSAAASASSETVETSQVASAANDGCISGYPQNYLCEWVAQGQTKGAWLQLDWSSMQSVSRVVIWDRPNQADNILAGTLTFSDGSSVSFGAPANDGSEGLVVNLPSPKSSTSVRLTVTQTDSYSSNIGLAELQVYGV